MAISVPVLLSWVRLLTLVAALYGLCLTGSAEIAGASEEGPGSPDAVLALAEPSEPLHAGVALSGPLWEPRARSFSLPPDQLGGLGEDRERWALLSDDERTLSTDGLEEPTKKGPDWPGIGRDTGLFIVYEAISVGILYALPRNFNNWSIDDPTFDRWWDNVSHPSWDSDAWPINYILHPYWGATYYIRARERGFGKLASFGYSALLSTMYEFGVEAFWEKPSGQDLMVTPILGSLIGAFVFEPIRDWVKVKPEFRWYDHVLLVATDPFGFLNSGVERLLGIKSEIIVRSSPPSLLENAAGLSSRRGNGARPQGFGISINIVLD